MLCLEVRSSLRADVSNLVGRLVPADIADRALRWPAERKPVSVYRTKPKWLYYLIDFRYRDDRMPEYNFYKKGKQIVALASSDENGAYQLLNQGYDKQFEEISATTKKNALTRFSDIPRNNRIDHRNFLAGAGTMPLIGILTAIGVILLRKKQP